MQHRHRQRTTSRVYRNPHVQSELGHTHTHLLRERGLREGLAGSYRCTIGSLEANCNRRQSHTRTRCIDNTHRHNQFSHGTGYARIGCVCAGGKTGRSEENQQHTKPHNALHAAILEGHPSRRTRTLGRTTERLQPSDEPRVSGNQRKTSTIPGKRRTSRQRERR